MVGEITAQEKRQTAASYFYTFYIEITNLNHYEAQYHNLMVEYKNKYNDEALKSLEPQEAAPMMQQVQLVRYHLRKVYIMYNTVAPSLNLKIDKDFNDKCNKIIKEQYIIDSQMLEEVIIIINKVIVNNVMKEILDTSEEYLSGIYEHGSKPNTEGDDRY